MRCIGQGLTSLKVFCAMMNLPPPVQQSSFDLINDQILKVTQDVAEESQKNAAMEEANLTHSSDISVSCDGSWLTRGHSSQFGVCSVIGAKSGKVIDSEVLSKNCKSCQVWKRKQGTVQYAEWSEKHARVCGINHTGTSGAMEVAGMKKIFNRSLEKHGTRYVNYIGDGDTRSYKSVVENSPYGEDVTITKQECVGHVQKRMGTRLRNLRQQLKGKKLDDGKPISGKNRLTLPAINTLSVYYGNAIREHSSSVDEMRRAIWAIWYHKGSTDEKPFHDFCPKGPESWCPYQRAICDNTVQNYKHKNNLPAAIMMKIKPIFKDLVATELLKRCVGGHTQNNNESLNSKIWKVCPKTGFAGHKIVNIAVNDAVITFNDGMHGRIKVLKKLSLLPGKYCYEAVNGIDVYRVSSAEKRALECTKEVRKSRKRLKLEEDARKSSQEGKQYSPGAY